MQNYEGANLGSDYRFSNPIHHLADMEVAMWHSYYWGAIIVYAVILTLAWVCSKDLEGETNATRTKN